MSSQEVPNIPDFDDIDEDDDVQESVLLMSMENKFTPRVSHSLIQEQRKSMQVEQLEDMQVQLAKRKKSSILRKSVTHKERNLTKLTTSAFKTMQTTGLDYVEGIQDEEIQEADEDEYNQDVNGNKPRSLTTTMDLPSKNSEVSKFIMTNHLFVENKLEDYQIEHSVDFTTSLDKLDRNFLRYVNLSGFLDSCDTMIRKVKNRLLKEVAVDKLMSHSVSPVDA